MRNRDLIRAMQRALDVTRPELEHVLTCKDCYLFDSDDAGLITHETDAFRKNRSAYRIAEPLLTFYHAIMRPAWGELRKDSRTTCAA